MPRFKQEKPLDFYPSQFHRAIESAPNPTFLAPRTSKRIWNEGFQACVAQRRHWLLFLMAVRRRSKHPFSETLKKWRPTTRIKELSYEEALQKSLNWALIVEWSEKKPDIKEALKQVLDREF